MSLVKSIPEKFATNGENSSKLSLAKATTESKSVLVSLARKQIEQERTSKGTGPVPATDLKDDSPELQRALDTIDLNNTAGMSADEVKTLETSLHQEGQRKQDENFIKSTVASDMIFYAFARRTDHKDFSRYLLNFANAGVAQEWWELVHAEYPDTVRHGPQFFSFKGDDLPGRAWSNKKFEQLSSKWFWTRMDDTGGRQQPIIPLQDAKGYVIGSTTNTNTAYVGTSMHSSSSITSSESLTGTMNSEQSTAAGGAGFGISAELSTVISQQAIHLQQVQELIAAQSAQIAAWGQLLSVLLQGGQLTSIQSLQGTQVGASLSQIIASLQLSGGVGQTTALNGGAAGGASGVTQGGLAGQTTTSQGTTGASGSKLGLAGGSGSSNVTAGTGGASLGLTGGSGSSGLTTGIGGANLGLTGGSGSSGLTAGTGGASLGLAGGAAGAGLGLAGGVVGTGLGLAGGASSSHSSSGTGAAGIAGGAGSIGISGESTSTVAVAAEASSAGHASGFASGHAAGFAAGLVACQKASQAASGSASLATNTSSSLTAGSAGTGTSGINIHGSGGSQNGEAAQGSSSFGFGASQGASTAGAVQGGGSGGGYGTSIHITGSQGGASNGYGSAQQASSGRTTSWDEMVARMNGSGGQSSTSGGSSQSGSYGISAGGSRSSSSSISASITAGQGGTVNAGRMTFNNTTFSAAIRQVAETRAKYLIQIGDRRSYPEVFTGVLTSFLQEGQITLSSGVQSSLSSSIIAGQAGTVNAGQQLIGQLTFGAFVNKAATMRSEYLVSIGDSRPVHEVYTGVFSALLAELQESMAT